MRTGLQRASDVFGAYIRLDLVEERMFPVASVLRYAAVIVPVLLYYFQTKFLGTKPDYFLVMLVGTSVTAGMQDALTGLTNRLQFAQERGTLETYLVEPVPWKFIPLAMNAWRSMTGMLLAAAMLLTGSVLGAPVQLRGIPLALIVLALGIVACNVVGTLAASFLILFKRGDPVLMLYGLGAGLLGGALFPTSALPVWMRGLGYLVPHTYVISAMRHLLVAGPLPGGPSLAWSLVVLTLFCATGMTSALWLFDRALRQARRLGVLTV